MFRKSAAALLLATALPFTQAHAHSVSLKGAPVTGYAYLMVSIGLLYFLFLLLRMMRRKTHNNSFFNK